LLGIAASQQRARRMHIRPKIISNPNRVASLFPRAWVAAEEQDQSNNLKFASLKNKSPAL
jgi:hypothetical protein